MMVGEGGRKQKMIRLVRVRRGDFRMDWGGGQGWWIRVGGLSRLRWSESGVFGDVIAVAVARVKVLYPHPDSPLWMGTESW